MTIDDIYIINNIRVVPLTNDYDLGSFYCGNSDIDHFLKNSAIVEQEEMLSRTYLICLNNDVIGFFTLSASSIEAKNS